MWLKILVSPVVPGYTFSVLTSLEARTSTSPTCSRLITAHVTSASSIVSDSSRLTLHRPQHSALTTQHSVHYESYLVLAYRQDRVLGPVHTDTSPAEGAPGRRAARMGTVAPTSNRPVTDQSNASDALQRSKRVNHRATECCTGSEGKTLFFKS